MNRINVNKVKAETSNIKKRGQDRELQKEPMVNGREEKSERRRGQRQ